MIFLWKTEWGELVLKPTHLLAELFSHSVTNKTLSRLFKALPGGGLGVAVPTLLSPGGLPVCVFEPDVESSDVM